MFKTGQKQLLQQSIKNTEADKKIKERGPFFSQKQQMTIKPDMD